tara:strand:+ start:4090 stop:4578 length:489 start_codon:yes stop_codon:yes gene_type:complete
MLRDRGCGRVTRAADRDAAVAEGLPLMHGSGGREVDVYVHGEDKVGVKAARLALEARAHAKVEVVMISPDGPTPFTRKECEDAIQFFCARDVCVNVTRHALVPKHDKVDAPPPSTSVEALPKILTTDRVVQYYAWPVGTVVRVWRCYGGHEPVPYFRVVAAA